MQVRIITCHDVYNAGASLQAFSLMTYLNSQGYETSIIDYKPEYLSRHYRLNVVNNPIYDKPVVKQLYLLWKLPRRLKALRSHKKISFDAFKKEMLVCTPRTYHSLQELEEDCPKADAYIAGSDQIWNPLFENGRDPAFFLKFVDKGKIISYAASFAIEQLPYDIENTDMAFLRRFDAISVREGSGLSILNKMGIKGVHVLDPVFLLDRSFWRRLSNTQKKYSFKYIYVYDFDSSGLVTSLIKKIRERTGYRVVSYFPREEADQWEEAGPLEFLNRIENAELIVSNSFHATAFSILLQKKFFSVGRTEAINSRILDLLSGLNLESRYLRSQEDLLSDSCNEDIQWEKVKNILEKKVLLSQEYLLEALG